MIHLTYFGNFEIYNKTTSYFIGSSLKNIVRTYNEWFTVNLLSHKNSSYCDSWIYQYAL